MRRSIVDHVTSPTVEDAFMMTSATQPHRHVQRNRYIDKTKKVNERRKHDFDIDQVRADNESLRLTHDPYDPLNTRPWVTTEFC
jgi:hypothetical protein